MRLILALTLLAGTAAAECPPVADTAAEQARLLDEVRAAPDEGAARALSGQLWEIWTTAPDETAQAMLDRGMLARETFDFASAVAAFDALVAYCPDYAEGYNQRAFANFLQGRYGEALVDLDRALELVPGHVPARSGKALTLMGLGRLKAAQDVLRDALEQNPWLAERRLLDDPPGEEL